MSKTIRVLGSGPLAGKVFYGNILHPGLYRDLILLRLDEAPLDWECQEFFFSNQTGMEVYAKKESDLLRIDPREIGHEYFSPVI